MHRNQATNTQGPTGPKGGPRPLNASPTQGGNSVRERPQRSNGASHRGNPQSHVPKTGKSYHQRDSRGQQPRRSDSGKTGKERRAEKKTPKQKSSRRSAAEKPNSDSDKQIVPSEGAKPPHGYQFFHNYVIPTSELDPTRNCVEGTSQPRTLAPVPEFDIIVPDKESQQDTTSDDEPQYNQINLKCLNDCGVPIRAPALYARLVHHKKCSKEGVIDPKVRCFCGETGCMVSFDYSPTLEPRCAQHARGCPSCNALFGSKECNHVFALHATPNQQVADDWFATTGQNLEVNDADNKAGPNSDPRKPLTIVNPPQPKPARTVMTMQKTWWQWLTFKPATTYVVEEEDEGDDFEPEKPFDYTIRNHHVLCDYDTKYLPNGPTKGDRRVPYATFAVWMHMELGRLSSQHSGKKIQLVDNVFDTLKYPNRTTVRRLKHVDSRIRNPDALLVAGLSSDGEGCAYGLMVDFPQKLTDVPGFEYEFGLFKDYYIPHIIDGSISYPVLPFSRPYVVVSQLNHFKLVRFVGSGTTSCIHRGRFFDLPKGERVWVPAEEIGMAKTYFLTRAFNESTKNEFILHMRRYYTNNAVPSEVAARRITSLVTTIATDPTLRIMMSDATARDVWHISHGNRYTVDYVLQNPVLSWMRYYFRQYLWFMLFVLAILAHYLKNKAVPRKWDAYAQKLLLLPKFYFLRTRIIRYFGPNFVYSPITHLKDSTLKTGTFATVCAVTAVVALLLKGKAPWRAGNIFAIDWKQVLHRAKNNYETFKLDLQASRESYKNVSTKIAGWPASNPEPYDVPIDTVVPVLPTVNIDQCNEDVQLKQFIDVRTRYKPGEVHCKPGFGTCHIMSAPSRSVVSAARVCHHNTAISVLNRGLLDQLPYQPASWRAVHNQIDRIVPECQIDPTPIDKWLSGFPPARQERLKKGLKDLAHDGLDEKDHIRECFVKREKVKVVEEGERFLFEPRLIQGASPKYQAATGPITNALTHELPKHMPKRIQVACGLTGEEIGAWYDWAVKKFDGRPFMAINGDFSRLDNTIRENAYAAENRAYVRAGVKQKYRRVLFAKRHNTSGSFRDGTYFRVRYTRCSGDGNTTIGNTIVCAAVLDTYLEAVGAEYYMIVGGDDSFTLTTPVDIDDFAAFVTSLGLKPKFHAHTDRAESEFYSALFWPTAKGTVLAPKPGRLLTRLPYTFRRIPPNKKYVFAKAVLLGVQRATSLLPVTRAYVQTHLQLLERLDSPAHYEPAQMVYADAHEPTMETYEMAARRYSTSIEALLDLENKFRGFKHPISVYNFPLAETMIKRDYAASLFGLPDLLSVVFEEALKRFLGLKGTIVFAVIELLLYWRENPTPQFLAMRIIVALMHVFWYYLPWPLAILSHCIWNYMAASPGRLLQLDWRPNRTEPLGMNMESVVVSNGKSRQPPRQTKPNAQPKRAPTNVKPTVQKTTVQTTVTRKKQQAPKPRNRQSFTNVATTRTRGLRAPLRNRVEADKKASDYLTCLLNPQVASDRGLLPKYPDRFDDKTAAVFAHAVLPQVLPIDGNVESGLTGPRVFADMGEGYSAVHVVPNLTDPIRVINIATPEEGETLSGSTSYQDDKFGIMSLTTVPSAAMLAGRMELSTTKHQISLPYSFDGQASLTVPPVRYTTDEGAVFYGFPFRWNTLTFTFEITPDVQLGERSDNDFKIYLRQDFVDAEGLEFSTQVYGSFDYSDGTNVKNAPASIFTITATSAPGGTGASRWPGNRFVVWTDAPVPITVNRISMTADVGTHPCMRWEPYQWPALQTYLVNFDKYRVVCMSALYTNTAPELTKNGTICSALIRGGVSANLYEAYNPDTLSEFNGAYNGPASTGTYVVWHPYDEVDMAFRDLSSTIEDKPYISITANTPLTLGARGTFRLLVYVGIEATTHGQAMSVSASPIDEEAAALAYRMWHTYGYPTATSNDLHSFIMDVFTKGKKAFDTAHEIYKSIPDPVKDFIFQSLYKASGIAALTL